MPSMAVSEHWTSRQAELRSEDFFDPLGSKSFALLHGEGRWIIYGEEPLLHLQGPVSGNLAMERSGELPPIFPDLIGFVTYEHGYGLDSVWASAPHHAGILPETHFSLHRRIRIYDRESGQLYEGLRSCPAQVENAPNRLRQGAFSSIKAQDTDTATEYAAKVQEIRNEIVKGNVYQVNLTRQERWRYQGDLRILARRLAAMDPAPHSAFIAEPGFAVISASPESFFRIKDGRIITRPIKGTMRRGNTDVEDQNLAEHLLSSEKNRSELAMIVDLLRNDLTRICRVPSVEVEAFPCLETFASVHHLVATVSGELRSGADLQQVLQATFPGGSITGCPKLSAMERIRALEPWPRSVYTGALGWCSHDFSQAEFSIAIRTLWADSKNLWFGVGGGVVWDSEPEEEYLETIHKGRSIVQCLSC